MNVTHELLNRARAAGRSYDAAVASGDRNAIEKANREGLPVFIELNEAVDRERATRCIKAAHSAPMGPAQFYAKGVSLKPGSYSAAERRAMMATGESLSDGTYPIKNRGDLVVAVKDWRDEKDQDTRRDARKHITRRATELGCLDCLPDEWRGDTAASAKAAAWYPELRKGAIR